MTRARCGWTAVSLVFLSTSLAAQSTARVSLTSTGAQASGDSSHATLSADGRFVAFLSEAADLVPGDTNGLRDVFVRDLATGAVVRANVGPAGAQADEWTGAPILSADGRSVAFGSNATNLVAGDSNGVYDVFVHDLTTGTTSRVSVGPGGVEGNGLSNGPSLSADGRLVSFWSEASNLVPGDTNFSMDLFVRDLGTGVTSRASVDGNGFQGNWRSWGSDRSLSADGRRVAFTTESALAAGDVNLIRDVYVRDLQAGTTFLVSRTPAASSGNGESAYASISGDGRFVAFLSEASDLVPGDTNDRQDAFVRELSHGTIRRVSVGTGGTQAIRATDYVVLSFDGRFAAFQTDAPSLVPGDTNVSTDVFVHDLLSGATTRVDNPAGAQPFPYPALYPYLSPDGRRVAFDSRSPNFVPGDTNGARDCFVHDRGDAATFVPFCPGDGSRRPCPCANSGAAGGGCENSAATGGARLSASGGANLGADTVRLQVGGVVPDALTLLLQGDRTVLPARHGDGLKCMGGNLLLLARGRASGGLMIYPGAVDPSLSVRSASLGHPIPNGATRGYQAVYRDPSPTFCPNAGSSYNISNAVAVAWGWY